MAQGLPFKPEWLSVPVTTSVPSGSDKLVLLGAIFRYSNDTITCVYCEAAKARNEFSVGKRWLTWKLDYLKRHITHRGHIDAVETLRASGVRPRKGGYFEEFIKQEEHSLSKAGSTDDLDHADIEEDYIVEDITFAEPLATASNTQSQNEEDLDDHIVVMEPRSRKRKRQISETVAAAAVATAPVPQPESTENEVDVFCKYIAMQLKQLPQYNAMVCQEKIMSIISQERRQILDGSSKT